MTSPMPGFDPVVLACLTDEELRGSATDCVEGMTRTEKTAADLGRRGVDRGSLSLLYTTRNRWEASWWNVQRELDRRGAEVAG